MVTLGLIYKLHLSVIFFLSLLYRDVNDITSDIKLDITINIYILNPF